MINITYLPNRSNDIENKGALTNIALKKGYTERVIKVVEWEKGNNSDTFFNDI